MRTLRAGNGTDGGSALVTAAVLTTTLCTIACVLASLALRSQRESQQARAGLGSFYAAEAGLSRAWVRLRNGGDGAIGSAYDPARIGGFDYWVTAEPLEDGLTSLVATGRDGSRTRRQELLLQDERSAVEDFGVFAEEQLTLRKHCMIDSYDSSLGSYVSQVQGDHARDNGNAGSNDDIEVSPGTRVYGYTQHGRDDDDSITLAPGATLRDGFGAALHEVPLLPIPVPSHADQGALTVKSSQPVTIGPGALEYTSLIVQRHAALTVEGPCELVITKSLRLHPSSTWTLDTTNGPIRVYALGNCLLEADATLRTSGGDPTLLTFLLCGTHDSPDDRSPAITFAAHAQLHGTVYAPGLSVRIGNDFELFGSVKAKWLEIGSGARVHFDESLAAGALDPGAGYGILAWRPLAGALAPTE